MDHLWSPWRFRYVTRAEGATEEGCVFCRISSESRDRENYVLLRGGRNFILLNLYPYTSGHLMVAPYEHVATLEETPEETLDEMMRMARLAERRVREVYRPQGLNLGMNIGECAGAGIAGHLHLHLLPRWYGDSNFMTTVGETRVLPEELDVTYQRLLEAFTK